jgi:RNA polymerase sigma factor (sigma-70 family)
MVNTGGEFGGLLRQVHRLFCLGRVGGLTDGQLLDRFVAGCGEDCEAAFEELMHRHGPMVLRVCRGMLCDPGNAEDAFQATFLVLAERARSIRRRDSVSSWLFGVARRVAAHARLGAARRRCGERLVAEQTPEAYRPAERGEEAEVLLEELERLPDRLRSVVVLCHLEGLTYEAAAQRLGLSEGAVRGRLARARARLLRRLTRRGVALSVGFLAAGTMAQAQAAQESFVTGSLVDSTIRMVLGFKAGTAAAALARGVLRSMFLSHLRVAVVVILAATGSSLLAWQSLAARDDVGAPRAPTPEPQANSNRVQDEAIRHAGVSSQQEQPYTAMIEVRDLATDAPIPEAHVECAYEGTKSAYEGAKLAATTGSQGTARVTIPDLGGSWYLNVRVSREGLVPLVISWSRTSHSPAPPERFRFRMERAVTVGGRVLDQDRRPVAGATVVIHVRKRYADSEQKPAVFFVPTRTDADDRWSFANVPEQPDAVAVGAYHHLYLTERTYFRMDDSLARSALRDRSAVLRLREGTRIDGTVVAPDGRPVADAAVLYGGDDSRAANSIPPVKTDSQGRFTLAIEPGAISVLTARHAGFGPALQTIRVGNEPQHVTLTLQPSHALTGRVVDGAGRPIPRASLSIRSWRGLESLEEEVTTDTDGRFSWKDAPGDEVRADVYAKGYGRRHDVPVAPGAPNRIVMTVPTTIKGTVVDAETGRPIPRFSLAHGTVWNAGEGLIWQRNRRADEEATKAPGSFEWRFGEQVHRLIVRVVAEGYFPADSGLFAQGGSLREFTFRLTRAEPIRGTVFNPDGSPAREGSVYLIPAGDRITLRNGGVDERLERGMIQAGVSPGGRFSLPPERPGFLLLALADTGFAVVNQRDFPRDNALRLRPWARVTGTVKIGTRPATNLELLARHEGPDAPPNEGEPIVLGHPGGCDVVSYDITTDAEGRFQLPRVVPGHYNFLRIVPNGVRRVFPVNMASLDVIAGQSYHLAIGGIGRPVTGRLVLPASVPWMVRRAAIEPRPATSKPRPYGVEVGVDGHFRAVDIGPGDYRIRVSIHEPPPLEACGWGRLIGEFSREFAVSPIRGGVSDDPLDLGELEPTPIAAHPLGIGDVAPDFALRTLDGKDLKLADFKGKVVLVDFWATWCNPCVAEIPNLKAVHDTFAADPRFAMLSLSLDESPALLKSRLGLFKIPWSQVLIGPDSPIADAYGAAAIPATFLIGPDGRILAKDLRGEKVQATVAEALERYRAAD